MTIQETKTGRLVEILKENNFNATLGNFYSNNYNQDYLHLTITVREANDRLSELWDLCKDFEIIVSKYANEKEPIFQIRKHRRFAELVEQQGVNYDLLSRRETTPLDNCTILTDEDWINYYNETC